MALKVGNNAVANAFVGSSQVRRAYKGGSLVFQTFSPASEQEFIEQTAAGGPSELLKVYGKSEIWRQLVKNGDFSNGTTNWQSGNSSISATNGVLTWTAANSLSHANLVQANTGFVNGRKYYVSFIIKGSQAAKVNFALGPTSGGGYTSNFDYDTEWTQIRAIVNPLTASDQYFYIRPNAGGLADHIAYFKGPVVIIDLTDLYGAGHEPASVAVFLADYPTYNPTYDPGSLQSNKTSLLRAERVPVINVWDEEWETGRYNNTTGAKEPANDRIRNANLIAVLPGTQYYKNALVSNVYYYDINKQFISYGDTNNRIFTTPANCYYIAWMTFSTYGNTYQNDICVNLSDPAINGTYYPHWRGSLALNLSTLTSGGVVVFPDGMRGVGSIRDEAEGSTAIRRIGRVNLGDLSWIKTEVSPSNIFFRAANVPSDAAFGNDAAAICANYPVVIGGAGAVSFVDKTITFGSPGNYNGILVKDSAYNDAAAFKAAMNGVYLDYKLATPPTYTLDTPLPTDLTCEQGDILQRVSDNNCPFVGEMKFGL